MLKRILVVGLILSVIGLAGCMRLTSLIVTPPSAIVEGGGSVTFSAADHRGDPVDVTWRISSGPGTITAAGEYTAPPAVAVITNATIEATRVGSPNVTGFATVTIKPPISTALVDAIGDTFGTGTYDIIRMSTSRTSTTMTVIIEFATPPTIPALGVVAPGDLAGFLTFDTDEAMATGIPSASSYFCPCVTPPLSAIGVEFFVDLFYRTVNGYRVRRATGIFPVVGYATPSLVGNILALTIPLTALGGDDGITAMNAVLGDGIGPTDCVPDGVTAVVTGMPIRPASFTTPYYAPFLWDTYAIRWGTSIDTTMTAVPASVQSGSTVAFTVRVENTGIRNVTLTSLIDVPYGDLTAVQTTSCVRPQLIAVGGFYECIFEAVVTGIVNESKTNTVTATAHDADGNVVTASDDATVTIIP